MGAVRAAADDPGRAMKATLFERAMVLLTFIGAIATAALIAWKGWPTHPTSPTGVGMHAPRIGGDDGWDCGATEAGTAVCIAAHRSAGVGGAR